MPEDDRGYRYGAPKQRATPQAWDQKIYGNYGNSGVPTNEYAAMSNAASQYRGSNPGGWKGAMAAYINDYKTGALPSMAGDKPPAGPRGPASGGRGRGRGRGGGGGQSAAAAAQGQIDYLMSLLASNQWKAQTPDYSAQLGALDTMEGKIHEATAADQAAATGAYNGLDQYLGSHNQNPYANVQLQQTQQAPSQNAYLASQGAGGVAQPATNNQDSGYGAFQNVLALLGANVGADQQSRGAESQMARTYAGQQIGAQDNAYLAGVAGKRAGLIDQRAQGQQTAQQQLDAERRQILLQLAPLIAAGGHAPDLSALGL